MSQAIRGGRSSDCLDDVATRCSGGLAISGIYDLEPIRLNYLNDKLGLDEVEAERNSQPRARDSVSRP
jgi:hypothetical protein